MKTPSTKSQAPVKLQPARSKLQARRVNVFGVWRLEHGASLDLGSWILVFLALALNTTAHAQTRPYIGYTYPAGGQQGTTFRIKLGGQGLDGVRAVQVSGSGVTARVVQYYRRMNPQETQLLNEQLKELKRLARSADTATGAGKRDSPQEMIDRIEKRLGEYVQTPACASLSALVFAEVTLAANAEPGERELRLVTHRGVSNPLVFHVGQLPEYTRKPMRTATLQVLGKEERALRNRPADEIEDHINVPCTVNGQIASGEVNRYRFKGRQGQRLVIAALARELIPFVADAVPGWFQPVLAVYDRQGKELAYADDDLFRPDPVIFFEVPQNGEYVFAITDAIHRGREDFVYRVNIGELPWVTSIFPLGAKAGAAVTPAMKGWNLWDATLAQPHGREGAPGIYMLTATGRETVSNPVRFALDDLPDGFEEEPNNARTSAQKVSPPIVINGRIDKPGDWDVFEFTGRSNETVVVEVQARRLDSPLDSAIKLTDSSGQLLAFNDDHEDLGAGVNTHQADSWMTAALPADGIYYVHLGDTARHGGEDYGYRLRISPPQPDFELRVVPSSISLRNRTTANLTVYAQRKDGFTGPIRLGLKNPPGGFSALSVTMPADQNTTRLTLKSPPAATEEPVALSIVGSAKIGDSVVSHEAVPTEDRMQAFLWRHLVPATELKVLAYDPANDSSPKRKVPVRPPPMVATNDALSGTNTVDSAKPKFTRQQIARRLRELRILFEEDVLTENFYLEKLAACDAAK